jgi:glucosamine-6-phosphate deaminase
MKVSIHPTPVEADAAATALLAEWLATPGVRNVMLAGGNTPLELYRRIAGLGVPLANLNIFALDEYVGVPLDEPRNCANLIRQTAVEPWGLPKDQYFSVSSLESEALESVLAHERRIDRAGGLDVIVLGLGQNGHLGFNEPGSAEDSCGRVLDLDPISIEANRLWFGGDYAPSRGVTVGMKTILAARRVLIMAYGAHKAAAVQAMLHGPRHEQCPASLLQGHANVIVFLDQAAAAPLNNKGREED